MEQLILDIMLHPVLNLVLAALCIITYMVNIVFLKLKREYKGVVKLKTLPIYLLPVLNLIFLMYNLALIGWYAQGYKVARVRYKNRMRRKTA